MQKFTQICLHLLIQVDKNLGKVRNHVILPVAISANHKTVR